MLAMPLRIPRAFFPYTPWQHMAYQDQNTAVAGLDGILWSFVWSTWLDGGAVLMPTVGCKGRELHYDTS